MIRLRNASERDHSSHGWLDSWHGFWFADYHDPQHMGFASNQPGYGEQPFDAVSKRSTPRLAVSGDGHNGLVNSLCGK